MSRRLRFVALFAFWLSPAALAVDVSGCNDGSTGCCMVCPECACGDSCISCSVKCMQPKGCACGSNTNLAPAVESQLTELSDAGVK